MTETNGKISSLPAILNGATLIPLGAALVIVCSLFLFAWRINTYLDHKFKNIEYELIGMHTQLDLIRVTLYDKWTTQDMKIWEQDLKIRNPALNIPDSRAIVTARGKTAPRSYPARAGDI